MICDKEAYFGKSCLVGILKDGKKCDCTLEEDKLSTKVFVGDSCEKLVPNTRCKGEIKNDKCVCKKG